MGVCKFVGWVLLSWMGGVSGVLNSEYEVLYLVFVFSTVAGALCGGRESLCFVGACLPDDPPEAPPAGGH